MTAEQKLDLVKSVLQAWLDKQGHERCWYYPELFSELVNILEVTPTKTPALPPMNEFEEGCRRYQAEEYRKL